MPSLYNATLVGSANGETGPLRDGMRSSEEATFRGRHVVMTGFSEAALETRGNEAAWLAAGHGRVTSSILHRNGGGGAQVLGAIEAHVEYEAVDPWLFDLRYGANPDPRPRT